MEHDDVLWKRVCDEEGLAGDQWQRDQGPRPDGPIGNCLCQWCSATRRYLAESQRSSATCLENVTEGKS
jgi:hypothetical protein